MKTLSKKLVEVRAKMSPITKDATNPHFRSKYADLASIIEAIKTPLTGAKLALYHRVVRIEDSYEVETTLCDEESDEKIVSTFPLFGSKPQELGSSLTYARRYNTLALLDLPTEDDDGNTANTAQKTVSQSVEPQKPWLNKKYIDSENFIASFRASKGAGADFAKVIVAIRQKWAVSKATEDMLKDMYINLTI